MSRAVADVISTYVGMAIRTCIPLAMLPLLSHRLGVAAFGSVLAAQSLALLGALLTGYGFQLSATRDIGISKNRTQIQGVVERVINAQLPLAGLTAIVVACACWLTPALGSSAIFVLATPLLSVFTGLYPTWYFQGRGRIVRGLMIDAAGQIAALGGIFFLAHDTDSAGLSLSLMVLGSAISLCLAVCIIWRDGMLKIALSSREAIKMLREGLPLFLARMGSATYTVAGAWFLVAFSTPAQAAYYGVASKLVSAMLLALAPVAQITLPRASRLAVDAPEHIPLFVMKWGLVLLGIALLTSMSVRWAAPSIISFIFPADMMPAVGVTKFLALTVIASAFSVSLSTFLAIPFRKDGIVTLATAVGAVVNFAAALVFAASMGAQGVAIGRLGSEIVIVLVMGIAMAWMQPWRKTDRAAKRALT